MLKYQEDVRSQEVHLENIKNASSMVDTSTPTSMKIVHLTTANIGNSRKKQLSLEKQKNIMKGNSKLVKKISEIYMHTSSSNSTMNDQYEQIDSPTRLRGRVQMQQLEKKTRYENKLLYDRLRNIVPSIQSADELRSEYQRRIDISSKRNRPLAFGTIEYQHKILSGTHPKTIQQSCNVQLFNSTLSTCDDNISTGSGYQYPLFEQKEYHTDKHLTSSSPPPLPKLYSSLSEFRKEVIETKKRHCSFTRKVPKPTRDINKLSSDSTIIYQLSYQGIKGSSNNITILHE